MKNQEQKTILLVEDEPVTLIVETHLLKGFGYDVVIAKSGEEAVQIVTGNDKIALILMDINLGFGMDGAEAARQILGKRHLPIVFLTAHTGKEYVARVKGVAGYGYVVKHSGDLVLQSSIELALNLFEVQEALRASEKKHRILFETMAQGVVYHDAAGKIISANPAAERILGLSFDQMQGRASVDPRWRTIHEDGSDFPGETHPAMVALRTGREVQPTIMGVFNPRHNAYRWIIVHATPQFLDGVDTPNQVFATFEDITERKRAENDLRESEKKYRQLMETLQGGVWAIDQDANTTFVNPHMAKMLGYSVEEMLGKPLFHFMDERGVEIARRNVERRKQGVAEEHDFEFVGKDGNRIYTRLDTVPLTDEKGNYAGALASVIDITERKQAEKIILDLSKFPSENPSPVLRIAKDGEILYSNKPGLELLANWNVKIGEKVPEKWRRLIKEALESAKPGLQEEEVKSKIFSIMIVPILEGGYANLYARNITDRKKAEEALLESEKKHRILNDSNAHGVLAIAIETGRFVYANPAICRMLGYSAPELLQLGMEDIHPKDALPHVLSEFKAKLKGGNQTANLPCLRKDGTVFYADVSGVQASIQGQACAVGFFVDVTDRKQAEKRIRMFSRELLAAHEEEKKRVSSALHHDVGSLVVGMAAYFGAMEQDIRSGKAGEALKSAKAAIKLFEQSVARLKEVAIELWPPDLDILGLRAAMRQHFSRITERVGLRIHFTETLGRRRLPDDTATILFRIAQESLTNAITHGQAKKVDVSLCASKKTIRLTIRDNGKGFDPSEHGAQKVPSLGLHMMQDMVTSAGGIFEIDSRRGKGTTVCVSLPLEEGR